MLSELGLVGNPGFRVTSVQFESPFVYLEAHEGLFDLFDFPREGGY